MSLEIRRVRAQHGRHRRPDRLAVAGHLVEDVVGDDGPAPLVPRFGLAEELMSNDRPVLDELGEVDAAEPIDACLPEVEIERSAGFR
jgi:hypothetical protein